MSMKSPTFSQKLTGGGGLASGFDYLRITLSLCIIAWHTVLICYGPDAEIPLWTGPIRPVLYYIVPAFFALSGFLVASSMARVNSLLPFLALRGLRIFPALCVEVLISALIIGPLLTDWDLKTYFSESQFFSYFLNVLGNIHYTLPGLFMRNKVIPVNLQLWTIPYELDCYVIITALGFIRLVRYPKLFGLMVLIFTAAVSYNDLNSGRLILNVRPPELLTVTSALWGMFLYFYRDKVPHDGRLFIAALVVMWVAFSFGQTSYVASLPLAYVTIFLGLLRPKKIFLVSSGDYSYGLYLYGFPIQQAIYQVLPHHRVWYVHFPLSLLISSICAYISWTFIESAVLSRKKRMLAAVGRMIVAISGWLGKLQAATAPRAAATPRARAKHAKQESHTSIASLLKSLAKRVFGKTIDNHMTEQGGHTSGFDYLRLALSIVVIAYNSLMVCGGKQLENYYWESNWRPVFYFIIPGFFALSGFLVAGSMSRVNGLLRFLTLRGMRIFPALFFEVMFTALIIGPIFTDLPLIRYIKSVNFHQYFLNIIGDFHNGLPFIFSHNHYAGVANLQLWTITYGLDCYIIITLLVLAGVMRRPALFGLITLLFTVGAFLRDMETHRLILDQGPPELLTIACFLWGIFLYLARRSIPYNSLLCTLAATIAWVASSYSATSYITALPVAYIIIYLGLMNPRRIFVVSTGDYSYGLYLYGFPIQQVVYQLFPGYHTWHSHFVLSMIFAGTCAFISWRLVESKVLARRKQAIVFVDEQAAQLSAWLQRQKETYAPAPN